MRTDVAKVITERAKSNRSWASKTPRLKQVVINVVAADGRSFNGFEIRDVLNRLVAAECSLDGGVLMSHDSYGRPQPVTGFYADPNTGLLLRS